jgi:hypothetical protein
MPQHQTSHCRRLATDCHRLALLATDKREVTLLISMQHSWTGLADQADRYVEFLKQRPLIPLAKPVDRPDWEGRANDAFEAAQKLPEGSERTESLKAASRLREVASMFHKTH